MNNLVIGEAKNNKKLLELGKEITQTVIDRFEETYFLYVRVEDIKDETLISIGKKLYSNSEAFIDYLRNAYEEENFEWDESVVNSYDLIYDIVSCEIVNSGEYFYDDDSELYFLATDISEIEEEEKLTYKINEIKTDLPLTILLSKEMEDFIVIRISDDGRYFFLENRISSFNSMYGDNGFTEAYLRNNDKSYVCLVNKIKNISTEYENRIYKYKFKLGIENELNKLLDINSFKFREVLPKEVEFDILKDYGLNRFIDGMEFEVPSYTNSDYLEYEGVAKKYLNIFLNKGSLKNLTEDELNFIYSDALRFREVDFIKNIAELYLKEYIMNILITENDVDNKFILIALYNLLLKNFSKIEPYIETMINNGFTFEKLNDKVKSLEVDVIEFKHVNTIKSIFNSYITKSNSAHL